MSIVKFGDIVREVKLNVDRDNNPYEFYVAGEHMDTEDLTIRCKGLFATDDVGPAFTRIFKKGQILYGSRRTYLKKVAVADFDGICSNTTFVLESKNEHVFCQKLLPFIMLTDSFTKWSISHSKGSTNPYILFSDLANYAFELPSLEEQRVLADKLWAAYEVKESYKNLLAQTDKLLHAQFQKMFGDPRKNDKQWDIKKMGEVFTIERGGSPRPITEYLTDAPEGLNWIKIGDAGEGEKYITSTKEKIKPEGLKKTRLVHKGDFLLSNSMSFGRPYILDIDGCIHDGWLVLHDNYQTFDKSYLYYFLSTPELYEQFKTLAAGGVVNNLNSDIVKKVEIIIPPLEMQLEFVRIAEQAERTKASLNKGIEAIEAVIRSLIAEGTTKV